MWPIEPMLRLSLSSGPQSLTAWFFSTLGGLGTGRERADAGLVLSGDSELIHRVRLDVSHDHLKVTDRLVKVIGAGPARGGLRPVFDDVSVQTTSAVIAG